MTDQEMRDNLASADGESDKHYAEHLAEINKEREVRSTEDITNSRGVLLVKKGTRIDNAAVDKIVKHKLSKPIDEQVAIEDSITNSKLILQTDDLLEKYDDLKQVINGHNLLEKLKTHIDKTNIPALIFQNLTVLQLQQPNLYEKALYTAILCCLISEMAGMEQVNIRRTFVAGIVHDLGLLRIDPAILSKEGQLTSEEWRAIQSHVVIGEMMIKSISGVSQETARAVLEHHERCDGTGYPAGKNESTLDIMGQIVGISDSLQAIRVNQFAKNKLNLANTIPYLQMNSSTYFDHVYRATYRLIKESGLVPSESLPTSSFVDFSKELAQKTGSLQDVIDPLKRVFRLIIPLKTQKRGSAVKRVNYRVIQKINQSGIISQELTEWLQSLTPEDGNDKSTLSELNFTHLVLKELTWQLESMRKALAEFLDQECPDDCEVKVNLQTELELISKCLTLIKR